MLHFALTFTLAFQDTTKKKVEDQTPVYNLQPIEVVTTRTRGYAAVRSVSATKTDTPLRDTPQSISIVTRDVIADQSMQTMSDVMRYVPGVSMGSGEGHRDAPTIRGNSSTADFFVDGVRDDAQYFRDLYNAERVEALKGSNAMIFGRGGGGGVINRVTKQASWAPARSMTLEGGSFHHRRGTIDINNPLNDALTLRINGMYEDSRSFRDEAELHRRGINPTLALQLGDNTSFRAGYEYFRDHRTVDRGIPSFNGKPSAAPITRYFGNPDSSRAFAHVHSATALFEHKAGAITVRNRAHFTDYDKFYQNSYASGAVNAAGTLVNLGAYNNATPRRNIFNQTDAITVFGNRVQHTVLTGVELGRQRSRNIRNTGYYRGTLAALPVAFDNPTTTEAITFKPSATDANGRTAADVAALYAQDQIEVSDHWQAILGVRLDRFHVAYHNNRTNEDFARTDKLVSPRAGVVYKPTHSSSAYATYSVSYLPGSGDQFSSLTATTKNLEPEAFNNYEVGGKVDIFANLSVTAAVYRLDRMNTSAPDPADPTHIVQTGSQRTTGAELNVAGDITKQWHVVAGVASQHAQIVSTTSAAKAGASVPLVPKRSFSLWNRYNFRPSTGLGLGILSQSDVYAAIDNTVKLPGFTRLDAAAFVRLLDGITAQLNVENVLNTTYYPTTQGNNNILPGASRTIRLSLVSRR